MAALRATAKKTTAKSAAKAAPKQKAGADVDEILGGEDDVLAGKGGGKAGKGKAAKGKAAKGKQAAAKKAPRAASGSSDTVRNVIAKTKKLSSYSEIAEANDFNIRMVRRTARSMRDAGEIELVKEGTVVYVKPLGKGK